MQMWQYIVTFIGSLIAALITAWFSVRWSARTRDKRALISLRNEIIDNIAMCKSISVSLDEALQFLRNGKSYMRPLWHLNISAWNTASSVIILSKEDAASKLEVAYIVTGMVNRLIQRIEETHFGAVAALMEKEQLTTIRQQNYTDLKTYIQESGIIALKDALAVIEKELSRYRWWRF